MTSISRKVRFPLSTSTNCIIQLVNVNSWPQAELFIVPLELPWTLSFGWGWMLCAGEERGPWNWYYSTFAKYLFTIFSLSNNIPHHLSLRQVKSEKSRKIFIESMEAETDKSIEPQVSKQGIFSKEKAIQSNQVFLPTFNTGRKSRQIRVCQK